jgi:hypothetical protein
MRGIWAMLVLTLASCAADPPPKPQPPRPVAQRVAPPRPAPVQLPLPAEPTPPLWTGPSGNLEIPGSLHAFPGERVVGDKLVEHQRAYVRTARLGEDFVVEGTSIHVPAGSPMFAKRRGGSIRPVDAPPEPQRPDAHDWCAIYGENFRKTVCFHWWGEGKVRYNVNLSYAGKQEGNAVFLRTPEGDGAEGPQPKIVEQPVTEFGTITHDYVLKEIRADGVVVTATERDSLGSRNYSLTLTGWDNLHYASSSHQMRLTPVTAADGVIRAVTVALLPRTPRQ